MMKMLSSIFRKLTPLEVATRELIEAELAKLSAASGREFADSQVKYNEARIVRLKAYIAQATKETKKEQK